MSVPTATVSTAAGAGEGSAPASRTAAYFVAFVTMGLTMCSLGPTLPGLAGRTGTGLGEASVLFAARSLGIMLGSLRGGRWFDRVPGHPVLAATVCVMALTMAVVPAVPALWLLAAVMLLLGAAEGVLDVGVNTLLVWSHGARVGPYMSGLHFFFGVGACVSPLVVAQSLAFNHSVAPAYWALALLALPAAFWLLRLPSPPARRAPADEGAGRTDRRLVVLIALFLFLYVGAEGSFGGWIYAYALAQGVADETRAAYLTSAFWGALTLGRLVAVPLAARFRPRAILLGDLCGCLLSAGVLLAWPRSPAAVVAGTAGLGFSMASIFPVTLSFAERRMALTGRVTGWLLVGASAGGMTVPWLIGQFFERAGPPSAIIIIACALVLELAVFVFMLRASRAGGAVSSAVV